MFRAYDAQRERAVAVKLFRLDLPPERVHQLVAAFEELISAELTHSAIAAPLATGISAVSAYLAHDLVAGESLDLAVREYGPAPPVDALRVAAQLAGALDFAAVVNVNHGTLHPRDALVSTEQARLTGLGVARALDRVGVAAPMRRPYTAPERAAGGAWDRRADVFSLAALVYELLSGRRMTGLGRQAADGLTEVPGARTNALRATFARALAEDPSDRFGTALEFAESLKDAFPDAAVREGAPVMPRYEDVTPQPAVRPEVTMSAERPSELHAEPPAISVIEQSRSAVWPLMAALVIGLAIGFAAGYGMGQRDRQTFTAVSAAPTTAEAPGPSSPATEQTGSSAAPAPAAGSTTTGSSSTVPRVSSPAASLPTGNRPTPRASQPPGRAADRSRSSRSSRVRSPGTVGTLERSSSSAPSGTAGGYFGRLSVESRPEGARVFLDGKLVGTTPLAVPNLGAGEHAIRLEREGYQRWSSAVRIVAGEQIRVTASLER